MVLQNLNFRIANSGFTAPEHCARQPVFVTAKTHLAPEYPVEHVRKLPKNTVYFRTSTIAVYKK